MRNNKQLYESIMRDVAKIIKKHLNENQDSYVQYNITDFYSQGNKGKQNVIKIQNEFKKQITDKKVETIEISFGTYDKLIIKLDYDNHSLNMSYNDKFKKSANLKTNSVNINFGTENEAYEKILQKINSFRLKLGFDE